ncbi:hypothetical protein [Streptomyces sp. KL118A]|uniref:hypothetical protein n=1 Tax=Streptomyces sp. KL118A TaxID=3045153 RepID=UPI00278BFF79|nr:hypothetical protein [Streptomyces sp. KL118A]
MALNVLGSIGWIGGWIVLLGISTRTPDWVVWIFMPYFIYGSYRVVVQARYFPAALRMLRILRTYPWQVLRGVPNGLTKHPDVLGSQYGWFELPNPASPGQQLPLVFGQHLRVEWWSRRMAPRAKPVLKAQIEVVWFAGDPRFIGLIAAPTRDGRAPRRLQVLQQQMGTDGGRRDFAEWGATPEDIERGRRVGIRPARS